MERSKLEEELWKAWCAVAPRLAEQTAPDVLQQSGQQLTEAALLRCSAQAVQQAVQEAVVTGPIVEEAVQAAARSLNSPDLQNVARLVIESVELQQRPELMALLEAGIGESRCKDKAASIEAVAAAATERCMLRSHQHAVATVAHYALQEALRVALHAKLHAKLTPELLRRALAAHSDALLPFVQAEAATLPVPAASRLAAQRAAREVEAHVRAHGVDPVRMLALPNLETPQAIVLHQPLQAPASPTPSQRLQEAAATATSPPSPSPSCYSSASLYWGTSRGSPQISVATIDLADSVSAGSTPRARVLSTTTTPSSSSSSNSSNSARSPRQQSWRDELKMFIRDKREPGVWRSTPLPSPRHARARGARGRSTSSVASESMSICSSVARQAGQALGDDSEPATATIESVADDVLMAVFRLLPPVQLLACGRVCRRWRALSRHVSLWRHVSLPYQSPRGDEAARRARRCFCSVLRQAPFLAMLDLALLGEPRPPPSGDAEDKQGDAEPPPPSARPSGSSRQQEAVAVPADVAAAILETECVVSRLRVVAQGLPAAFVMQVLHKFGPGLWLLDLTPSPELCALTVAPGPEERLEGPRKPRSALFAAMDEMTVRTLRLSGTFDVEYMFGPRRLGAPRRVLTTLDLSDYRSSSPRTACSLVSAHRSTLTWVSVSAQAGAAGLLSDLSLCPWLTTLTVPADVLERHAPPSLTTVLRLTLTRATRHPCDLSRGLGGHGRGAAPMLLPALEELTLDSVASPSDVPHAVRASYPLLRALTFRFTGMQALALLALICETSGVLRRLVFENEAQVTDKMLVRLASLAPQLTNIAVLGSLRCSDEKCWRGIPHFFRNHWPRARVDVDYLCGCVPYDDKPAGDGGGGDDAGGGGGDDAGDGGGDDAGDGGDDDAGDGGDDDAGDGGETNA